MRIYSFILSNSVTLHILDKAVKALYKSEEFALSKSFQSAPRVRFFIQLYFLILKTRLYTLESDLTLNREIQSKAEALTRQLYKQTEERQEKQKSCRL